MVFANGYFSDNDKRYLPHTTSVGIYLRKYRIHTLKSEPTIKRRLFLPILHSAVTGQAVRASSRVGTRADVCTCERDKYIARDPTLLSSSLRTYVCNMKVQRVQYPGQKLLTELETYPPSYTPSATVTHKVTSCTAILLAQKVKDGQEEGCMRTKKER